MPAWSPSGCCAGCAISSTAICSRFPLPHLRRVSQGELVQMINAETEALGGFVGEAVSTPGLQAGTLLTSLFFMFVQDWKLGWRRWRSIRCRST